MTPNRRRTVIAAGVAAVAGLGAGIAAGLGDGETEPSAPPVSVPVAGERGPSAPQAEQPAGDAPGEPRPPEPGHDPAGTGSGPSGPPPGTSAERAAASAARGYVQALDRRAAGAVCRSLAFGALDDFEFPRQRPTCAASTRASLGRSERGGPRWSHSRMTSDVSAAVGGDRARVVATVLTTYRGQREPTIEDDIVHLTRSGDRWLVAKPSLTFHRAMGDPDPPLSALAVP